MFQNTNGVFFTSDLVTISGRARRTGGPQRQKSGPARHNIASATYVVKQNKYKPIARLLTAECV